MAMRLFLLLFLNGQVFTKEAPDVDCLVLYLKYVNCSWNKQGTPEANYTFYSWFSNDNKLSNCTNYVSENNVTTGCSQAYDNLKLKRFKPFYTKLVHGNKTFQREFNLKNRVLLFPPVNQIIQIEPDDNLWFYWNHTESSCVESEVRLRINNNNWDISKISIGRQSFCINLPHSSSRYEVQVRSKFGYSCGESEFWSNWSEPVVWGSNNGTDTTQCCAWTPVLYVVGVITLIILVMMLLHYERLRVILIPVVPKPSLIHRDMENWLQSSKGLNLENFKPNYNERACPVREYCEVSQSDNESSDGSTCSVTTFQTDCSVSIPANESEELSVPCSSSTSTVNSTSEQDVSD